MFAGYLLALLLLLGAGLQEDGLQADLLLIPGNTVQADGQPAPRLAARLQAGLTQWQHGCCQALLVSGGVGKEGFDEAKVMAQWLRARGVPAARIIIDSAGNTTEDSAQHAALLIRQRGWHSVLVASQYYHLPRCRLALHRAGVVVVGQTWARYLEARDLYSLTRELPALLWYSLR